MDQGIGLTDQPSRDRIIDDGYTSLRSIIMQHKNDVKGFCTYLSGLNRTFTAAGNAALRVYYSPVVISRFAGVVHYYNQCVHSLHTIPDASFLDNNFVDDLMSHYLEFRKIADKDKEDAEVTIPTLTGASDWINFREKLLLKLSLTIGSRGFPIDYVVDPTVRSVERANAALIEADEIDLSDVAIFRTKATLFGDAYKRDNKLLWNMLKRILLGTPAYNHIHTFNNTSNGRAAWKALKDFFEGEDFQERLKEQAFNKILHTYYRGDNQRFTFENISMFIRIHIKCSRTPVIMVAMV